MTDHVVLEPRTAVGHNATVDGVEPVTVDW